MNKNYKDTNDDEQFKQFVGIFSFSAVLYITFIVVFQIFDFTIDYGFSSIWAKDGSVDFEETRFFTIYMPVYIAGVLYLVFIMSKIFDGYIRLLFQTLLVPFFLFGMLFILLVSILLFSLSMPMLLILLKILVFISVFILFFSLRGVRINQCGPLLL